MGLLLYFPASFFQGFETIQKCAKVGGDFF